MQQTKPTHVRYLILLMLFLVTTINYADRATIAIAGSSLQKDLGIDAVTLGYIFSAFGWAYVAGQIPGGWLLDRFGSKRVYALSIFTWSLFTVLQGYVGEFGVSTAIVALFMLRFLVGLAEAHRVENLEQAGEAARVPVVWRCAEEEPVFELRRQEPQHAAQVTVVTEGRGHEVMALVDDQ